MLASRYASDSTVVGFDLHNEPHDPATWGDGTLATDWRLAAERAGNAVLGGQPAPPHHRRGHPDRRRQHLLVGRQPEERGRLPGRARTWPNQLVYSPHDYPATVFAQTWFSAADYPANLAGVWDAHWGYLASQGIAPIWVGEFGTKNATASDQQWFAGIAQYLGQKQLSFSYWCWNPDSGDTGGILQDDWQTVNADKQTMLQPLLAPALP